MLSFPSRRSYEQRVLRKVPWAPSEVSRREIRSSGVPILDLSAGGSFQGPEVMCFRDSKFVAIGEFSGLFLCQNVERALQMVRVAPWEVRRRGIHDGVCKQKASFSM